MHARSRVPALEWKLTAAFAASLLVLLVGGAGLWAFEQERAALDAIRRTRAVIDATRELRQALADAEIGERGYVITEDRAYLLPYEEGLARLDEALATFERAAAEEGAGADRVERVGRLVTDRVADLQLTVSLVRGGQRARALDRIRTDLGGDRTADLRRLLGGLEDGLLVELRTRREDLDQRREWAALVVVVGTAAAFVLLMLVYVGVRHDVRREAHRQRELEATNEALAEGRRALTEKNDELERQLLQVAKLSGQLAAKNSELEGRNADLDRFAYVASHDLRAPLRGIGNLTTWIEEDLDAAALPEETRQHLQLLRSRVERMEGLIDGILAYSRAGRRQGPEERLVVADVAREVLDLLDVEDEGAVRLDPSLEGLEVCADRVQLAQVIQNLVGNALKHGGDGAVRVEIGGARRGGQVEVWVRDDGPGIDPRFHERIFGIFQTLAPRDEVESTGIGLALVRRIVESRRGTVGVESRLGEGAVFRFTWPAAAAPPEHA